MKKRIDPTEEENEEVVNEESIDQPRTLEVVYIILWNVLPSVLIILINKLLFLEYSFPSATILSFLHLLSQIVVMSTLLFAGVFKRKPVSIFTILSINIPLSLSQVFQAMSVKMNSLSTFMVIKQLTIPLTAFAEVLVGKKMFTWKLCLVALLMTISSTLICGIEIQNSNMLGILVALLSVVTNVSGQMLVSDALQNSDALEKIEPLQLRFEATVKGGWVMSFGFLVEFYLFPGIIDETSAYDWSQCIFFLALSCILAPIVAISFYFVVETVSLFAYQILSPLKLSLVIFCSMMFFHEEIPFTKFLGLTLAVLATFIYTKY